MVGTRERQYNRQGRTPNGSVRAAGWRVSVASSLYPMNALVGRPARAPCVASSDSDSQLRWLNQNRRGSPPVSSDVTRGRHRRHARIYSHASSRGDSGAQAGRRVATIAPSRMKREQGLDGRHTPPLPAISPAPCGRRDAGRAPCHAGTCARTSSLPISRCSTIMLYAVKTKKSIFRADSSLARTPASEHRFLPRRRRAAQATGGTAGTEVGLLLRKTSPTDSA